MDTWMDQSTTSASDMREFTEFCGCRLQIVNASPSPLPKYREVCSTYNSVYPFSVFSCCMFPLRRTIFRQTDITSEVTVNKLSSATRYINGVRETTLDKHFK